MTPDLVPEIGIAGNPEIEAPSVVDPGLPEVAGLVIFLGVERGAAQILVCARSTASPALMPALRRTLFGTTSSSLDVTTTVMALSAYQVCGGFREVTSELFAGMFV
jgi:hypothetical protein